MIGHMNGPPARTISHMGQDHTGGRVRKGYCERRQIKGYISLRATAITRTPSVPIPSSIPPSRRVSRISAPARRQRSSVMARDCESAIPPVAIANPAPVASIHSGAEASELPCRLISTTSLASSPGCETRGPVRLQHRYPRLARCRAYRRTLAARIASAGTARVRPKRHAVPLKFPSRCTGRPAATWQASRHRRARHAVGVRMPAMPCLVRGLR